MGGDAVEPDVRSPRLLRGVLLTILVVIVAAVAIRAALGFFAADLFAIVVREAASRGGVEVVFESGPEVTVAGFDAHGVTVRSEQGETLLRAAGVSGTTRFFLHRPFLGVSLKLTGAELAWREGKAGEGGVGAKSLLPSIPTVLSRVELADARLDLGGGRAAALDAGVSFEAGGGLEIDVARLDYSESSGENAAEKLAGTIRLVPAAAATDEPAVAAKGASQDAAPAASPPSRALRFEVAAGSGAALAGSVLLDFHVHPLTVTGLVAEGEGGGLAFSGLVMALGKLVRLAGRADLAADGALRSLDATLESDDLMPAFVTLAREPFAGVAPAIADATIDGKGRLALRLEAASRHASDATLSLSVKSLRTRSVAAESMVVDLPWTGAALSGRPARAGRLRAASLSLFGLPWTGVDAGLTSAPGRLRAPAGQEWKTAAGTLRLSGLVLEDDPKDGPRLSARLELVAFDLATLGHAFGVEGLAGSLGGDLGQVRMDAGAVRTDGVIEIRTFGGSVRLSKLLVEHPFSRVPEFGLDAKVEEIDLGAMTSWLGVGRISGVLEGHVTGLVLADGQPQSFDADLHTVRRSGVSQTVDVRAIVQLGVIGGGDSGSITGALLRVVDRYRYSALGMRCRLRNDVFEIRGVETEGGKDYIVKGSLLPPSVSVVSHSQVVSFSEMLRRVQRVTSIGEGGSPNASPP